MKGHTNRGQGAFVNLAIRILSMVPNSASTESTFSIFGNTQTKIRNRLSVNKTHNATLVRMAWRQHFKDQGLTQSRKKRKFTISGTTLSATIDPDIDQMSIGHQELPHQVLGDESDPDFATVAAALAREVQEEMGDEEVDEHAGPSGQVGPEAGQMRPWCPPPSTIDQHDFGPRIPAHKKVSLGDLFRYDLYSKDSKDGLCFYWDLGIELLNYESRILEASQTPQ
jgi:hypothetical protein